MPLDLEPPACSISYIYLHVRLDNIQALVVSHASSRLHFSSSRDFPLLVGCLKRFDLSSFSSK